MKTSSEPVFNRITITGDPGSGKSVFAHKVMEQTGYRLITTGTMFRKLAAEKNISITDLNELAETQQEIDREVDDYLKSLNDVRENLIFDSRMAWHFLRGAFKIRLKVDPEIAAQRIYKDGAEMREKFPNMEEATKGIERRRHSEVQRYYSLYGVYINDDSNFDLVIDTSDKSPEEIITEFNAAFENYKTQRSSAA
jgi:CMP/dCMP kinase